MSLKRFKARVKLSCSIYEKCPSTFAVLLNQLKISRTTLSLYLKELKDNLGLIEKIEPNLYVPRIIPVADMVKVLVKGLGSDVNEARAYDVILTDFKTFSPYDLCYVYLLFKLKQTVKPFRKKFARTEKSSVEDLFKSRYKRK